MKTKRIGVWQFILVWMLSPTLTLGHPTSTNEFGQNSASPDDLHAYLVGHLDVLKFQELDPAVRIATYLSISKELYRGGREELAKAVEADAYEVAECDKNGDHARAIFDHALETKQFELAEEIANRPTSRFMKKRLIAARIRSGDIKAFKKEDYKVTDFYTADMIARALVDSGQDETAIDFATGLVFEANDGNDPKTIPGFVYTQIALKEFKAGKIDLAKQHIDKAKAIAGKLFYTGYCIEVDYKTIHGTLTDNVETFAEYGAAHRSHMGDELVAGYARALRENGYYQEARQAIKHIVKPDNVDYSKTYLAIQQIKKDEFELATESIEAIQTPELKFLAQMHLAVAMKAASKVSDAETLVAELEQTFNTGQLTKCENRFWYLLGATNDYARTKKYLERLGSEQEKAKLILAALRGLAKA